VKTRDSDHSYTASGYRIKAPQRGLPKARGFLEPRAFPKVAALPKSDGAPDAGLATNFLGSAVRSLLFWRLGV